jgi:hypothetical protein
VDDTLRAALAAAGELENSGCAGFLVDQLKYF